MFFLECIKRKLPQAVFIFVFLVFPRGLSASSDIEIYEALKKKGFENIYVNINSQRLLIIFENRIYRYYVDALKFVMNIVSNYKDVEVIKVIVTENQLPIFSIVYNNKDYNDYLGKKINHDVFVRKVEISYNVKDDLNRNVNNIDFFNSSIGKVDVVLVLGIKAQFGDYDNPIRAQFNLIPEINTSLWKGMQLIVQTILPLYNEFYGEGDYIRPGIISINQNIRLDKNFFISVSAGYFTENRYGIDLTLRKIFFEGQFAVGINTGYTGFLSSYNKKIFYSNLYLWTGNVSMDYRISEYDLNIGMTLGKFLYGDKSIRLDVNRQFGEIEIGFFYVQSISGEKNGGFNFSLPIFPSEYCKPSFIRIRPVEYFRWEYKVKGALPSMIGITYNTGNSFLWKLKKYNPDFLYKRIFKKQ